MDMFEQYWKYTETLRNWFVIYGVGGIALFVSQPDFFNKVPEKTKYCIAIGFVVAVITQVVVSAVNKWVSWFRYAGDTDESFKSKRSYKIIR